VNVFDITALSDEPSFKAMAFIVFVSVNVNGAVYSVLSAVGVLLSSV
jgi:hypothetical protein